MLRVVAVDAGTTSVRALATDLDGTVIDVATRQLAQSYPQPGWVEQDATEILTHVDETLEELAYRLRLAGDDIAVIGITNQRETTVAIDRADGRVLAPAIVWQDRRTAPMCAALVDDGHAPLLRAKTGLTADPYFSATKMRWLVEHGVLDDARDPGLCTIDSLVCWHLTGGVEGGAYVTDPTNASRTLLYDLDAGAWSEELCALFGVPVRTLAEVRPSCGVIGAVPDDLVPGVEDVEVSGILGDQQAALLGQRCTRPGMVKATFGTGAFLLAMAGPDRPADVDGLLTTVAWDLGEAGGRAFALEGSAFVAGAAIQWLVDGLGVLATAREAGRLAASVPDAGGAAFVPALAGLGSPWWDADARGALTGLSRGITRAHVARAVVDALSFEARAILEAMRGGGVSPKELRVDGGAAQMAVLCQTLADGARVAVRRPISLEATAVGAAVCAALGIGVTTLPELEASWGAEAAFDPADPAATDAEYASWLDAVERARTLAASGAPR